MAASAEVDRVLFHRPPGTRRVCHFHRTAHLERAILERLDPRVAHALPSREFLSALKASWPGINRSALPSRHAAHLCRFSAPRPNGSCVPEVGTLPALRDPHGTLESAGEDAAGSGGKLGGPSACQGSDRGGMPRAGPRNCRRGNGPPPLGATGEWPQLPSAVSSGGAPGTLPPLRG